MNSQALHINDFAQMSGALSDWSDTEGMSLLLVNLLALFISVAISVSSVVEIIGINIIVGVLSLLIILPILISGIINLILIIS